MQEPTFLHSEATQIAANIYNYHSESPGTGGLMLRANLKNGTLIIGEKICKLLLR